MQRAVVLLSVGRWTSSVPSCTWSFMSGWTRRDEVPLGPLTVTVPSRRHSARQRPGGTGIGSFPIRDIVGTP